MDSIHPYNYHLLGRALAISLLVHGVLLLQPGLGGDIRQMAIRPLVIALIKPELSGQTPSMPALNPAKSLPPLLPPHRAGSRAGAATETPSTESTANQMSIPADAGATMVAASPDAGSSIASVVATEGVGTDIAEDEKSYKFAILAEARSLKYPERARMANWSGSVDILIPVELGGVIKPPRVVRSSGYADLDQTALASMSEAVKKIPVPDKLRGRRFDLTLPFIYRLRDE